MSGKEEEKPKDGKDEEASSVQKGILSYLLNHNHLVDNPTFPKKLTDWSKEDVQKYFNSKGIFKKYAETMVGLDGEDLTSFTREYLQFLMSPEDGGACFTLLEKYKRAGTHFSDYKSHKRTFNSISRTVSLFSFWKIHRIA